MGLTLIKALTATTSPATTSLTFVDDTSDVVFDNTYNEYQFYFVNLHPQNNSVGFTFQVNATDDAGGGYDTSLITTTHFQAYHNEADSSANLAYSSGNDAVQSASFVPLLAGLANDDDNSANGVFTLYDPSSPTYVKHFTSNISFNNGTYATQAVTAGYINDTTAIDEIRFKMDSGNIDAGTIYMYGVS